MSGAIHFYRSRGGTGARLHIGWRKRGYSPVWYEPIGDYDHTEDDGMGNRRRTDIGLFAQPTGDATDNDPMPGEVIWHPWYAVDKSESSNPRERAIIHKQDLEEFYAYLIERDERELALKEAALNDPGKTRRFAFLQEARKWKRKDMRARRKRRSKRASVVADAGVNLDGVEINSDSSDDSGVEMEAGERTRAKKRREMPPPPVPSGRRPRAGDKRRADGSRAGGRGSNDLGAQRAEQTPSDHDSPLFFGSGGLGNRAGLHEFGVGDAGAGTPRPDDSDSLQDYDFDDPSARPRTDSPLQRHDAGPRHPTTRSATEEIDSFAQQFGEPRDPLSGILPSVEPAAQNPGPSGFGTPRSGTPAANGTPRRTPSTRGTPASSASKGRKAVRGLNAGLDYRAAVERAVSESLVQKRDRFTAETRRRFSASDGLGDGVGRGADEGGGCFGLGASKGKAPMGPSQTDGGDADGNEGLGGSDSGEDAQTGGQGGQVGGTDAAGEKTGNGEPARGEEGADGGKYGGEASGDGEGGDHTPKDEDGDEDEETF